MVHKDSIRLITFIKCYIRESMIIQSALVLRNENRGSKYVELLELVCKWRRLQNYVNGKFVAQNKRWDTIVVRGSFWHVLAPLFFNLFIFCSLENKTKCNIN
jgi:hypothetical protein